MPEEILRVRVVPLNGVEQSSDTCVCCQISSDPCNCVMPARSGGVLVLQLIFALLATLCILFPFLHVRGNCSWILAGPYASSVVQLPPATPLQCFFSQNSSISCTSITIDTTTAIAWGPERIFLDSMSLTAYFGGVFERYPDYMGDRRPREALRVWSDLRDGMNQLASWEETVAGIVYSTLALLVLWYIVFLNRSRIRSVLHSEGLFALMICIDCLRILLSLVLGILGSLGAALFRNVADFEVLKKAGLEFAAGPSSSLLIVGSTFAFLYFLCTVGFSVVTVENESKFRKHSPVCSH